MFSMHMLSSCQLWINSLAAPPSAQMMCAPRPEFPLSAPPGQFWSLVFAAMPPGPQPCLPARVAARESLRGPRISHVIWLRLSGRWECKCSEPTTPYTQGSGLCCSSHQAALQVLIPFSLHPFGSVVSCIVFCFSGVSGCLSFFLVKK